jgi:hypothetical protein
MPLFASDYPATSLAHPLRFTLDEKGEPKMETVATFVRQKSNGGSAKIDWPRLAFWAGYLSLIVLLGSFMV